MESDTVHAALRAYNKIAGKIRKYQKLNSFIYMMLHYISGARSIFNKKVLNQYYKISIDGEDYSGVYGTINIANGPCYGGYMHLVITAMPNDGALDVIFLRQTGSFKTARLIKPHTMGEYRRFPDNFTLKRFRKIEICSRDPLLVDLGCCHDRWYAYGIPQSVEPVLQ
jgi:diacylglycerol kinase family enzyme